MWWCILKWGFQFFCNNSKFTLRRPKKLFGFCFSWVRKLGYTSFHIKTLERDFLFSLTIICNITRKKYRLYHRTKWVIWSFQPSQWYSRVQGSSLVLSSYGGEDILVSFGGYNGKYNNEVWIILFFCPSIARKGFHSFIIPNYAFNYCL